MSIVSLFGTVEGKILGRMFGHKLNRIQQTY